MDVVLFALPVIFSAALIAAVAFVAIRKNNRGDKNADVCTVKARVINTHLVVRNSNSVTALGIATDTLEGVVVFETQEGKKLQFNIIGKPYRDILDGDEGLLTYQGHTFISFERSV